MQRGLKLGTALATVMALAHGSALAASNLVARWVEYAPGTTAANTATNIAIANGTDTTDSYNWGDAAKASPLTRDILTPTILVRAILSDTSAGCPAGTLENGATVVLKQRFVASSLTSTPGTVGATNSPTTKINGVQVANNYPQYFVSPTATTPSTLPDGSNAATTSWNECEAVVPAGHSTITLAGDTQALKLPVAKPKRILVMADTGCRMNGVLASNGANEQNCHSPAAFPLTYLSQYEATFKPDAILQVGDWFYRDSDCTGGVGPNDGTEPFAGCNTKTSSNYEVWGDTFDSWNADVIYPMHTLLGAAPWIMARGNHESCGRGARGWFALLDAYPYNASNVVCAKTTTYPSPGTNTATYNGDFEPSYVVPLAGVNFIVHDSSFANDSAVDGPTSKNYDIDLSNIVNELAAVSANAPAVFATHKPTFGLSYGTAPTGCATGASGAADASGDWTEQGVFNGSTGYAASAFKNGVPANIALFISGHVHQFQYFNFNTAQNFGTLASSPNTATLNQQFPPQLIVGTGGSLLDADCNTGNVPSGVLDVAKFKQTGEPYTVQTAGTGVAPQYSNTFSHDEFGFALLDLTSSGGVPTGYTAEIYKISSARAGVCKVTFADAATNTPRKITCSL